ncbi:hypothetical protein GF338_10350 [candidate division WOR-3 bacterium]|nr:hypothetical protein [candidate division WOR-3 bacterium]
MSKKRWSSSSFPARLTVFAEPGFLPVFEDDFHFRAGSRFLFPMPFYSLPLSLEVGWAFSRFYSDEEDGFYLLASASLARVEVPYPEGQIRTTHLASRTPPGLKIWAGYEFLGIGPVLPSADISTDGGRFDVTAVKIGAGFTPPLGLGFWLRLWMGTLSDWWGKGPVASARLVYTPFMTFAPSKHGSYRETRIDLFAEPGYNYERQLLLRTGVNASFSFLPVLFPVSFESGLAFYPNGNAYGSGFYFQATTGLLGGEFTLKEGPSSVSHVFSKYRKGYPVVIAEGPSFAYGITWMYPIDIEINILKAGIMFSPPLGLGLGARMWYGTLGNYDDVCFSTRASFFPFTSRINVNGSYSSVRTEVFVEPGIGFFGSDLYFRTGGAATFNLHELMPAVTAEVGWARLKSSFGQIESGAYFLLWFIPFLKDRPVEPSKTIATYSISTPVDRIDPWTGFRLFEFSGMAGTGTLYTDSGVIAGIQFIPLSLGVGLGSPANLSLWAKHSFVFLGNVDWPIASLRLGFSPYSTWQSWDGLEFLPEYQGYPTEQPMRRTRIELFAEPGIYTYRQAFNFRTGISVSYSHANLFLPVSAEAGINYSYFTEDTESETGFYITVSTAVAGGEFSLSKR